MTMKKTASLRHSTRRDLLGFAALWPWIASCALKTDRADPKDRLKGIGLVLVVDAVPGAEMWGVAFYNEVGGKIYTSAFLAKRNREILALGGRRVPLTVRVVWRDRLVWANTGDYEYGGEIVGDYTIPVAERIPQDVVDDIRAHGGGLRLKFRLKPDGVLFGWDIERRDGGTSRFDRPGGDFLDTWY